MAIIPLICILQTQCKCRQGGCGCNPALTRAEWRKVFTSTPLLPDFDGVPDQRHLWSVCEVGQDMGPPWFSHYHPALSGCTDFIGIVFLSHCSEHIVFMPGLALCQLLEAMHHPAKACPPPLGESFWRRLSWRHWQAPAQGPEPPHCWCLAQHQLF